MEDRNNEVQRPHTWNPKRYISLVSLLLWHKIVASFGIKACEYGQAVRQLDKISSFYDFFKIQYPAIWRYFIVLNVSFDVRWTSTIM